MQSLILEIFVTEGESNKPVVLSRAGISSSEENTPNESHSSHCLRKSGSEPKDGRSFGAKRPVCERGPGAHGVCANCLQRSPFGERSVLVEAKASISHWRGRRRNCRGNRAGSHERQSGRSRHDPFWNVHLV